MKKIKIDSSEVKSISNELIEFLNENDLAILQGGDTPYINYSNVPYANTTYWAVPPPPPPK